MRYTTDYRKTGDLYADAVSFGSARPDLRPEPAYWTAWFAGRRASGALLAEARDMGLTADQVERLRKVAARVAYD